MEVVIKEDKPYARFELDDGTPLYLEYKVYSSWAFSAHELQKRAINKDIYKKIKDKAKIEQVATGYAHKVYRVVDNPEDLPNDALALICDRGNLCFGYSLASGGCIKIYTD